MADRTGQTLGHYRLVRLLGQGGFADVYLGEHLHLGTEAALKLLHTQLAGEDPDAFRREARTIACLVHPHIVRVFDFGIEGETPYLVMDYAPNGTVRKQHPKGVAFPLPIVLSYVKQTASALQYAHDEHFIHRDVKPENLLVGRWQEILLGDFGIALLAQTSRSQSMQDVAGTASYMAPEQFQGKPRPASDQYALAIMVYEWLTGACPFHGSFTEVASQHLFVPPPPLQGRTPTISPVVEQVVLTALAKDPHQRFSSVHAFATAFEQACQLETSPTRPSSQPLSPTETMPQPRPTQSPTELATPPSESVIPVELITPPSQSSIPTGQSIPPSQQPISTEQSALLSQTEVPPALVTPPSQASLSSTELASPAPKAAALPTEGTRLPQLPGTSPAEIIPLRPPQRGISRRTVVVGLAGLAVAGGGLTLLVISHGQQGSSTSLSPTATSTHTPTSSPTAPPHPKSAILTYHGHSGAVQAVAWSPDGTRIASGSYDRTAQVWNATTGTNLVIYSHHSDTVYGVAWSPDSTRIASGSNDGSVQIWNAASGSHILTYGNRTSHVNTVVWSPNGKYIAWGTGARDTGQGDHTVQVWDATTGRQLSTYHGHTTPVYGVAWSPDSTRIASVSGMSSYDPQSGGDYTVQVWEAATGNHIQTHPGDAVVTWSPDGTRIASGGLDTTVQVWETTSAKNLLTLNNPTGVWCVAWSPNGKYIASGTGPEVNWAIVFDATNGSQVSSHIHGSIVFSVAWSPDSRRIASASDDSTVQVWQAV